MMIVFVPFLLALLVHTGVADKKCSIYRATFEDFQQTFATILSSVDGPHFKEASAIHTRALESLGHNVEYVQPIYDTFKELRDELLENSRSCEEDIEELRKKAQAYLNAGDTYLNSQKALENFKTDPKKINDPFLAEFYAGHEEYNKAIWMLVEDPEFKDIFFSQTMADSYAAFTMVEDKIYQRYALDNGKKSM